LRDIRLIERDPQGRLRRDDGRLQQAKTPAKARVCGRLNSSALPGLRSFYKGANRTSLDSRCATFPEVAAADLPAPGCPFVSERRDRGQRRRLVPVRRRGQVVRMWNERGPD
jgi:hypothetical protein